MLHPEKRRWAYLRVGMAELFIGLLLIGVQFAANFLILPLFPLLMLVGALAAFHQIAAAIIVGVAIFIVAHRSRRGVYVGLRFAAGGADDRR